MRTDILGGWSLCDDGRCHHFLRGKSLCGSRAKAKGPVPVRRCSFSGRSIVSYPRVDLYCPMCLVLQSERWSGEYGDEAGVPLDRRGGVT